MGQQACNARRLLPIGCKLGGDRGLGGAHRTELTE